MKGMSKHLNYYLAFSSLDPYTSVKYLAERVDLVKVLNLKYPDEDYNTSGGDPPWSAWDICEGNCYNGIFRSWMLMR